MTRKITPKAQSHTLKMFFATVLTALATLTGLAQVTGAGRSKESADAVTRASQKRGAMPLDTNRLLFLPAVTYDSGGISCSGQGLPFRWVAAADVNGDGKPDMVLANCGNDTVSVLLGNGDGTFQPAVTYNSGGQAPLAIAIADVNRDGKPDIVVTNSGSGTVGVLRGNGDGTYQPVVTYDSGGPPADLAVADVNRDGKPDLVVVAGGAVAVLLGNGDGTFEAPATYDAGAPTSVVVADVNRDGNPDLLVANWDNPGTIAVLLGKGDGSFMAAVNYASGGLEATSIAVADVNGDHKPDLVVANWCGSAINCPNEGSVGVLLGNGDGTFQAAVAYDSGGYQASAVAVADVNGDGKPDLAVANWDNGSSNDLGVLLGNGDGTFQSALTYGSGAVMAAPVVLVDVNGNGWLDLVVGNLQTYVGGSLEGIVGVLLNNSGPHSPTTTTLVSSLNPAPVRTPVTYTATVTSQDGDTVTGSVMFQDNGASVATVGVSGNRAAYTTSYSLSGTHSMIATYSGDIDNGASVSAVLTEKIDARYPSTTVATTSGSPSLYGKPVTFIATVTSIDGAIPNGELVTFYDGYNKIGTGTTSRGVTTFTTSSLTAKTHTITAIYAGDTAFKTSSGTVTQVVDRYATTTVLVSNLNPSTYGRAVTFTATVTSTGPKTPTGNVKFGTLGYGTLSGGVASITKTWLNAATYPTTAVYQGDSASAPSNSSVLNQVVNPASTTTAIASSANPSSLGQTVIFTSTVTSSTGAHATGTVTFTAGANTLGTVALNGIYATISTPALPVGSTTIKATYNGVQDFRGSSASVTQTVQ